MLKFNLFKRKVLISVNALFCKTFSKDFSVSVLAKFIIYYDNDPKKNINKVS